MSDVYSLWIVPDRTSEPYRHFAELIRDFAGTYDDASAFEPHVTVCGEIAGNQDTILDTTETLIQNQQPLSLRFTSIQCSTTRHQCVFVLVEPTLELLSLHQAAVQQFDRSAEMYVPHLSLVYSDMSITDRLALVESLDVESLPAHVCADTVAIAETSGSVSEWDLVATYQL